MTRLAGKIALVTGGGRGIGLSLVQRLAEEGARVVVNDLDAEPAEAAAKWVKDAGGEAIAYSGSVTGRDFAAGFIGAALSHFGDIHILVNNAGYVWNGPIHKIGDAQWDAMQDVHLKVPFRILRELHGFLEARVKQERAAGAVFHRKVVNVSSVAATGGTAGQVNYSAAKAGLHGLTKSLAKEWGPLAVNVNCVAFGYIDTRLTQEISGETVVMVEGEARRVGLTRAMIEAIKTRLAAPERPPKPQAASCSSAFRKPTTSPVRF
jgi:3-oxoacyl-[acyl-carrier protein] reductase